MTSLYPFTFTSVFKYKPWGGRKLSTHLGKDYSPHPACGESWEISGLASGVSVVKNGALAGVSLPALLDMYKEALVGKSLHMRYGNHFPLLVKFIDAEDDLSIQVHPNDALAGERHGSLGKTEMWYVIQADKGASLIAGFNQPVSAAICRERFSTGRADDILNREAVMAGDVFFLPAGRVHAVGKGLLVAEIQQASDVTYRLHDYDRVDANGQRRALDMEGAIAALDFGFCLEYKFRYQKKLNEPVRLVNCEHFTTNILECIGPVVRDYTFDSFVIHVCVQGNYRINYGWGRLSVRMGDCVLIPAAIQNVILETDTGFTILECFIL
jgi:mannose-6-phosphate isomerase